MNNFRLKASALALAVSSALLVACGGGSSGGTTTSPTISTGLAVDGPLAGATVTFKDCNNQTTTTAADGTFAFPAGCSQSEIVITGGIDTTSGLDFTGELQAPAVAATNGQSNHVIVSPITTLINYANGDTSAVVAALNLPAGTDPLTLDPLTNKELLIKTFVVQQLIEEIQKTITSLGVDPSTALTLSTQAVTETLLNRATPATLTDPAFIHDLVVNAVTTAAPQLSIEQQNNLENLQTNVAALTTQLIVQNVTKVETALEGIDLSTSTDPIEVLKNFAQQAIVASKESVTTSQLIQVFTEILTQPLSNEALTALNQISAEFASGNPDPMEIENALSVLQTTITVDAVIAANFYPDYFKFEGFSLNGQAYSAVALNQSLIMPIPTSINQLSALTDFRLNLSAVGNGVNAQQLFSATLRIRANDQNMLVHIDKILATFDSSGHLTGASIPNGAQIYLSSNLPSLVYTNTITINNPINALVENGQLTFTPAMLATLSPSLASGLNNYVLSYGTIVTIEAIVDADERIIAVNDANGQPQVAKPLTLNTYSGRGVNAKFQIQP